MHLKKSNMKNNRSNGWHSLKQNCEWNYEKCVKTFPWRQKPIAGSPQMDEPLDGVPLRIPKEKHILLKNDMIFFDKLRS